MRLDIATYGLQLAITVEDGTLVRRVRSVLPPPHRRLKHPPAPPDREYALLREGRGFLLRRNRRTILRAALLETALARLETDIALWVAEWAHARVFVHAGVVGWRGRAILLPGRTLAGKSTLVAALVRAGATYYSDEYAVLDRDGRVEPYPRPIALRDPPRRIRPRRIGRHPLPVGLVVVTRFHPRPARLRPLSPGRCVLALLKQTIAARSRTDLALGTLTQIATHAKALYGSRGEARRTAAQLLELV